MCLGHDEPLVFAQCQWQSAREPNIFYLLYRLIVAIYFCTTLGMSYKDLDEVIPPQMLNATIKCMPSYDYIHYLTRGVLLVCCIEGLLGLVIIITAVLYYLIRKQVLEFKMILLQILWKPYWIFNTIATDTILPQQFCFWYKLYILYDHSKTGKDFFMYGSNTILILIDFLMVAHPVRFSHFWVTLILGKLPVLGLFCTVYFPDNIKYCNGEIPKGTDPNEYLDTFVTGLEFAKQCGWMIAYAFGSDIAVVIVHIIFWLLQKVRSILKSICGCVPSFSGGSRQNNPEAKPSGASPPPPPPPSQ